LGTLGFLIAETRHAVAVLAWILLPISRSQNLFFDAMLEPITTVPDIASVIPAMVSVFCDQAIGCGHGSAFALRALALGAAMPHFFGMRITLIHAMSPSIPPIEAAFRRLWPEATLMHLLDSSLASDLAADGELTPAMTGRFLALARYAKSTGADAILFTCSAFGPCIEACARELAPLPVLKPNEAMIEEALALTGPKGRIGLMATFAPTLTSMPPEFDVAAPQMTLVPCLAEGALAALNAGDPAGHDAAAVRAAMSLTDCDVIALAQFSLSQAAEAVSHATGKTVLTTPDSAVRKLRRLLLTAKAA
jgi:hypothetical protein